MTRKIPYITKRRFFYSLLVVLLLTVVFAGWFATEYLGNKARREIIAESRASVSTLSIYVSATLGKYEEAVKSMAGSPWIAPALTDKGELNLEHANSVLDRYSSSLNSITYLMDARGMTVASSNRNDPGSFTGNYYGFRPYFQDAAEGRPGRYFALGVTSGKRGFYASHPVKNDSGKVIGVVTMKKDLDEIAPFFRSYPFCFFISRDGVIFLSSTPSMVGKSLWPLEKTVQDKLIVSQQFGNKISESVIDKKISAGPEVTLKDRNYFVSRNVIDSNGWSIVLLAPTDRIGLYRLAGITATAFLVILIMVFSSIVYVTDRSRETIRQEQIFSKSIIDSLPGTFHLYSYPETRLLLWNRQHETLFGFNAKEMKGRLFTDWVTPENRDELLKAVKDVMEKGFGSIEVQLVAKDGHQIPFLLTGVKFEAQGHVHLLGVGIDLTKRRQIEMEREQLIVDLKNAVEQIKTLKGIVPICAHCKKIRDDKGFWEQVDAYVAKHTEARFSHGICPDCMKKFYSEYDEDDPKRNRQV
ncbi:MAG: cache domain-containing protein [Myxococcota bacterium]|jgi:PAS domain S-box-containing protein